MDYLHALDRYRFLTILNAANNCEEYQFAKQAVMLWLVNFPGDLYVKYHQALTFEQLGNRAQAKNILEDLISKDPSFIEPYEIMSKIASTTDDRNFYQIVMHYLTQKEPSGQSMDNWLSPLWDARTAYTEGDFVTANDLIHQSLLQDPPSPIPAILHLKTAYKMENQPMLENLCDIYYSKWPQCLQINVIKALVEIDNGHEPAGVERLHYVASQDSAGQVIQRLMGSQHRFIDLWPDRMEIAFDLPIPASVSTYLGWNQLNTGTMTPPDFKEKPVQTTITDQKVDDITQATTFPNVDESISKEMPEDLPDDVNHENDQEKSDETFATEKDFEEIHQTFSRLAKRLKKPDIERADNRFPVYVIMTCKKQLEAVYGPNTAAIIDDLLNSLVIKIQKLPDWGGLLFYPDDPAQMSQLGLKPVLGSDAWQVKLSLADLDQALSKQGEMIGALLIVGGPEIVPFHHLPNPTNDNDLDVPSDNPYTTVDENYFISQWPVGRLPGETGSDAGLLLSQIRQVIYQYEKRAKRSKSGLFNLASIINWIMLLFNNFRSPIKEKQKLGYSAEIWREASEGVYKVVGKPKDLELSPPTHSGTLMVNNGHGHNLGYFNLHGVKDGPHWYGQKDFTSVSNGPDYPIALSPSMFSDQIPSPKLVFTEACYGANVHKKHHEDAIALKFLDSGTGSFIGSTCIAYGSVTLPLIAADYLAENFWKQVLDGQPAGYALMHAKLSLAEEMTRTQGFLDGEDQKTILSFVLLGDPLAVHDEVITTPKPLFRIKSHPAVRTISDSDLEPTTDKTLVSKKVSKEVKSIVEKYLPGLDNAKIEVNKSGTNMKNNSGEFKTPERYVVTLQKSFDHNQHTVHHHFARMTFDKKGKLVKFTTSR